jgi:hypothetical protein
MPAASMPTPCTCPMLPSVVGGKSHALAAMGNKIVSLLMDAEFVSKV